MHASSRCTKHVVILTVSTSLLA